jgi:hypothetical protein
VRHEWLALTSSLRDTGDVDANRMMSRNSPGLSIICSAVLQRKRLMRSYLMTAVQAAHWFRMDAREHPWLQLSADRYL